MFDNIGSKIKYLAQTITIISIICYAAIGLALMIAGSALIGFAVILIGLLLSWVSSFLLYGFGQLIENSDILVEISKPHLRGKKSKSVSETKNEIDEKNFTEEDFIKEFLKKDSNSPKDFFSEVKNSSTADLMLILRDQRNLYNEEEITFIETELKNRRENI